MTSEEIAAMEAVWAETRRKDGAAPVGLSQSNPFSLEAILRHATESGASVSEEVQALDFEREMAEQERRRNPAEVPPPPARLSIDKPKRYSKFCKPENYDPLKDLGPDVMGGANDWESGLSWVWLTKDGEEKPSQWHQIDHADCPGCKGTLNAGGQDSCRDCNEYGMQKAKEWVAKAKGGTSLSMSGDPYSLDAILKHATEGGTTISEEVQALVREAVKKKLARS